MRPIPPQQRLLVFAKAPIPGRVKTRLQTRLNPVSATVLYKKMVLHALRVACASHVPEIELWCSSEHAFFLDCKRRFPLTIQVQKGKDLGTRMYYALKKTLLHRRAAIIMGTDCPAMNATYLQAALHELNTGKDVVLGPSEDGGYVLIGARRIDPAIFNAVNWGESCVLAQTRSALRTLGWSWSELDTLWDVDRSEDLDRLCTNEEFSHVRVNASDAE